jgi:hypothetical protein
MQVGWLAAHVRVAKEACKDPRHGRGCGFCACSEEGNHVVADGAVIHLVAVLVLASFQDHVDEVSVAMEGGQAGSGSPRARMMAAEARTA